MRQPSTRVAAAVAITALSIALAEVSIGSAPLGLIFPPLWILLVPIYGAQVILLVTLALRRSARPTLTALWSVGVVMGLYEFYITHVLWDSPWDGGSNGLLVEPAALLVVAGFYHPFVSVIAPLALTETLLTGGSRTWGLLPGWISRPRGAWPWVLLSIAGIVAGGLNRGAGPSTLVTLPLTALALWAVLTWAARAPRVAEVTDALPRRKGLAWAGILTAGVFAPFVVGAQLPQWQVSPARQAVALAFYAAMMWLAWRNLRHTRTDADVDRRPGALPTTQRGFVTRGAVFVGATWVGFFLPGSEVAGVALVWGGGAAVAAIMLWLAIAGALRTPRAAREPRPADQPALVA